MSEAVYYRVIGGEPLAFCHDYRARRTAHREKFFAFAKAKGAKGFVEYWGWLGGLVFDHDAVIPKGWKAERRRTSDGSIVHTPHKKTPEGKALAMEISDLGCEPRGNEFAERFGIPMVLKYRKSDSYYGSQTITGIFPDTSFVAWVGDEFFIVLPDIDAAIADRVADGCTCEPSSWTVPEGIKHSSRAHYDLALAKSKVVEEEAKNT